MIKFSGRILQFGFGAVGKSFFEKLSKEISYNENNYYVITGDDSEFKAYVNLGGIIQNFIVGTINKDNFAEVFGRYIGSGDLLIDFADTVGTKDICRWCAQNNIMYINTGEADWPENWYSILDENLLKVAMKEEFKNIKVPIVLQHGNNPGLVSHFVKRGLESIVEKQFKQKRGVLGKRTNKQSNEKSMDYKQLKELINGGKFNELAKILGVRMIHVNDIDTQQVSEPYNPDKLYTTWCMDSFWFEMLSEATCNIGPHEKLEFNDACKRVDRENGFLEFEKLAADKRCKTIYPGGSFEGYLVPHEETITISKGLEVRKINEQGQVESEYRPTVMFIYSPCDYATRYFKEAKVNNYPNPDPDKPQDKEDLLGDSIIRGYKYPKNFEMLYQEKISAGTEYVGVLIMGENFDPVWVGNRVEMSYLYKSKKSSYWQTPTITPVAMSALAAVCWMIKNKDKGGIYFPDDIKDYGYIIGLAEKYISKTIYKTFSKEELEKEIGVDSAKVQLQDVFAET